MLMTRSCASTAESIGRGVAAPYVAPNAPDQHEGFRTNLHLPAAAARSIGYDVVRYEWNGASAMSESRVPAGTELSWLDESGTVDPRHVFLTAGEVMARYRWGRTKGYKEMRCDTFPKPIAGRYRLDLLMAWEDDRLEASVLTTATRHAGPPAKRRRSGRTDV